MKSESKEVRNPFGVMDVPNPNDQEVVEFAASAKLRGSPEDENAKAWNTVSHRNHDDVIEGDGDRKPLFLCPITGYPCEGDLSYLCEDYGCARKAGLSPRSEENL
jgi:hypothetical protein